MFLDMLYFVPFFQFVENNACKSFTIYSNQPVIEKNYL
jgi:hypothetical protein